MKYWVVVEDWGGGDWYVTTFRHSVLDKVPGVMPWNRLDLEDEAWLLTTLAEAEDLRKVARDHCPGAIHIVEVDVDG